MRSSTLVQPDLSDQMALAQCRHFDASTAFDCLQYGQVFAAPHEPRAPT
jgi:hypothetical protein